MRIIEYALCARGGFCCTYIFFIQKSHLVHGAGTRTFSCYGMPRGLRFLSPKPSGWVDSMIQQDAIVASFLGGFSEMKGSKVEMYELAGSSRPQTNCRCEQVCRLRDFRAASVVRCFCMYVGVCDHSSICSLYEIVGQRRSIHMHRYLPTLAKNICRDFISMQKKYSAKQTAIRHVESFSGHHRTQRCNTRLCRNQRKKGRKLCSESQKGIMMILLPCTVDRANHTWIRVPDFLERSYGTCPC